MVIRTAFSTSGVENTSRFLESCQWISVMLALLASLSPGCAAQMLNGSLLVDATVNGVPASFMVDTGAERTVLDRGFAERLGLQPVAEARIQRPYSSEDSDIRLLASLAFQNVQVANIQTLTDDLAESSRAIGKEVDGVLGEDILREFVVTLNYSTGLVRFRSRSPLPRGHVVRLRHVEHYYLIQLTLEDAPLYFLLDTGTNLSVLSDHAWKTLLTRKKIVPAVDGVRSTASPSTSKLICIHRLVIGGTSYRDFPIRVAPFVHDGVFATPDVDGILGSDFLERFTVSLDLANNSLYLSADTAFKADPDLFHTIGIQFAKDTTGAFVVAAVWTPTPASAAGLRIGDELLSINGLPTNGMTNDEVSRHLHGRPGTRVGMIVRSGKVERHVRIDIQALICQSAGE